MMGIKAFLAAASSSVLSALGTPYKPPLNLFSSVGDVHHPGEDGQRPAGRYKASGCLHSTPEAS